MKWSVVVGSVALVMTLVAAGVVAQQAGSGFAPPNQTALRNEALGMVGQITGKVIDENGKPIANAKVIARFTRHKTGAQGEGYTSTNAKGEFLIRGLGKDQFYVYVHAPELGYISMNQVEVDLTGTTKLQPVTLKAQLGPEVTVEVIDPESKKAVEGIQVTVGDSSYGRARFDLVTDTNGKATCRIPALRVDASMDLTSTNGRYSAAPWYGRNQMKELKKPEPILFKFHVYDEKKADRSFEFSGKVFDTKGNPVEGATIEVIQSQTDIHRGKSKADGTFSYRIPRLSNRAPQDSGYTVKISKGQLMSSKFVSETQFWEPVSLTLDNKQARYFGTVVDTSGNPISNCYVTAYDYYAGQTSSTGGQSRSTDQQGRFAFEGLVPGGSIHFRIGDPGGQTPTGTTRYPLTSVQTIEPGEHDLGRITVPRAAGTIVGTILDDQGKPFDGNVGLVVIGEHCYAHVQLEKDGKFKSQPVPDEPLMLYVFTADKGGFRSDPKGPDVLLYKAVKLGSKVDLKVKWRKPAP